MALPDKTPERQVHEAVGRLIGVLEDLPAEVQSTALECLLRLYKLPAQSAFHAPSLMLAPRAENDSRPAAPEGQISDFFSVVAPAMDWEKALTVAAWVQHASGSEGFTARSISRELDNLGHGVSNITHTLNSLINKKFVIQIRKAGKSQQARKLYKVTATGTAYIDGRLMAEKE